MAANGERTAAPVLPRGPRPPPGIVLAREMKKNKKRTRKSLAEGARTIYIAYICNMIELARHIEALLLENDCVIVPRLGGFVTHYSAATHASHEHKFLPPTRSIGFNPRLKINDGLLVQSYMQAYNVDYAAATRMVSREVDELLKQLHETGKAALPAVGELRYNLYDAYGFIPCDTSICTPNLYGLCSFEMPELSVLRKKAVALPQAAPTDERQDKRAVKLNIPYSRIASLAAMIAVVALFFLLSTPIENTEITTENYAQMFPEAFLNEVGKKSVAFAPIQTEKTARPRTDKTPATPTADDEREKDKAAGKKAIVAREVKVADAATATPGKVQAHTAPQSAPQADRQAAKPARPYHIIVASMATEKDARDLAEALRKEGHNAQALIGNGRQRVSIACYATSGEAYTALQTIRKQKDYQSAWVLKQ